MYWFAGESWVSVSTLGGEGRDSIAVSVIPLAGIQVGGPTAVLCVGGRAPLWAQPLPEVLSPLALASVNPSFTYTWTSSLPGVAHITDRYAQVNIHVRLNSIFYGKYFKSVSALDNASIIQKIFENLNLD